MMAYQLGDESAFHELYDRYSGRVLGFLRSKVSDATKAQDLFQTTFLKLHQKRSQYKSSFPFAPWLFTICRNEFIDSIRKSNRSREDSTDISEFPAPESSSSEPLIISSLNQAQQSAVEMRFNEGSSFEDIAKALDTSPSNARQLVSRAIRSLRRVYGKK